MTNWQRYGDDINKTIIHLAIYTGLGWLWTENQCTQLSSAESVQWMTISFCKTKRKEMKSVLCKMTVCTLRDENLYFTKILTLWNENLYFAKHLTIGTLWNVNQYFPEKFLRGSFCKPSVLLQSSPWHMFFVAA